MKKALLLLILLPAALLARDFDKYVLSTPVSRYPELSFSWEFAGIRIFNAPQEPASFCQIDSLDLKVVVDSLERISSKQVFLYDRTELEALQVLSVWNAALTRRFGKPKSMVVDGSPIQSANAFDNELKLFFESGELFDIIYGEDTAANTVSLNRIDIDGEVSYSVSVFISTP